MRAEQQADQIVRMVLPGEPRPRLRCALEPRDNRKASSVIPNLRRLQASGRSVEDDVAPTSLLTAVLHLPTRGLDGRRRVASTAVC